MMSISTTPLNEVRLPQRYGPLILLGLGLTLVIVGGWLAFGRTAITIPPRLAGLPLSAQVTGPAALAEIDRLHGQSFLLTDGTVARYNGGAITVWISDTWLPLLAARQVSAMTDRIAEGNSPFTPQKPQQVAGFTVYPLTGLGQVHFYFQHDRQVVWLAAPLPLAQQSLTDFIHNLQ